MIIKLLIDGGNMKPGPTVAQQLGPIGLNMGKVISDVNEATKGFKGMKVPVELNIDEKTKDFEVKTSSPPTSELIKKELSLEKGTADHKKIKVGNASIEDIIKVAKVKHPNMLERDLKSAVKSVLGTCASAGVLVEDKEANILIQENDKVEIGDSLIILDAMKMENVIKSDCSAVIKNIHIKKNDSVSADQLLITFN